MSKLLELHQVNKTYSLNQNQVLALNNVSLEIQKGEFIAIVGASGSGKSTLLHLLGLLDQPSSGEVIWNGHKTKSFSEKKLATIRNQQIGFIFQDFLLLEELSVFENIALPLLIGSSKAGLTKEQHDRVLKLLAELGLEERAHHRPAQISGGQKQRTAIGRALINQPKIILADEPTGNLDSKTGQQIIQLLTKIAKQENITLIVVTHDEHLAKLADRIIKITDGQIK
ncbi:ABC transporter ATP-binding protein [Candidatus Peregrinibacteria bacterium]|nr:ABC transporter ATP-binding protein [Candidatus Peregrinibacteria bacterium]